MKYETLFKYHKNLLGKIFYHLKYDQNAALLKERMCAGQDWEENRYPYLDRVRGTFDAIHDLTFKPKFFFFRLIGLILEQFNITDTVIYKGDVNETYFFVLNSEKLQEVIDEFNRYFQNEHHIISNFRLEEDPYFKDQLNSRIQKAEDFYITQNKTKIEKIYNKLSDKISKLSFQYFLRQRVDAHIRYNIEAMYPILPPKVTEEWRKNRKEDKSIVLPELIGAQKYLLDCYYWDTFIIEQYAIEGAVFAEKGDIVIDAGTFIGDTAIYFAEKVGKEGKVYAFEPIPDNIEKAKENLKLNNVTNVELIPLALSDEEKDLNFHVAAMASASYATEKKTGLSVKAICLDDFVKERGLEKVDFIKCDLEGSDMAMLKGAKETIQKYGPKLGLALYHRQEDFITITDFITSIRPEYKLYFRCETEPVLLAIITR